MGFLFITAQQTEKLIVPDSIQKAKFAETVEKIANMDLEKVLTNLVSESIWVGLKIVLALAIYMAGRWLIGRLIKLLSTAFEKRKVDRSLQIFLRNLIKTISYIVLILLIIQVMGINTTSIVALLASAGLAIGRALSSRIITPPAKFCNVPLRAIPIARPAEASSATIEVVLIPIT